MLGRDTKIIEEDDIAKSYVMPNGCFDSVQIVDKNLFKRWFVSSHLGERRVIRAEDVDGLVKVKSHLLISPKKQLCCHFDQYEYTVGSPNEIALDRIPPLFIPDRFFNNSIKIAYGYEKYRKGWVNINPAAKKYSFRDEKYGTDLKICLEDIPLFWKSRIKKIDINKKADLKRMKELRNKSFSFLINPWDKLEPNFCTARFHTRLTLYKILVRLGIVDIIRPIHKKHKRFYYFLRAISIC